MQRFVDLAGKDVKITWSYENGPEQPGTIHIPQTLGTSFKLLPGQRITKIGDMNNIEKMSPSGNPVTYSAESWVGARELTVDTRRRLTGPGDDAADLRSRPRPGQRLARKPPGRHPRVLS